MFLLACYAVFRPIILIELVGSEKLSDATGIALLVMGVASTIAPPFVGTICEKFGSFFYFPSSGWIADLTSNFAVIYMIAGGFFIISGIIHIFITPEKPSSIPEQPPEQTEQVDAEETTVVETIEEIIEDPRQEFQVILNANPQVLTEEPSTLPAV